MQKMSAAKSRITTREMELIDAHHAMYRANRAHKQNASTRKHLAPCRRELVKNIPKEAIMNASILYKDKQRLFSAQIAIG